MDSGSTRAKPARKIASAAAWASRIPPPCHRRSRSVRPQPCGKDAKKNTRMSRGSACCVKNARRWTNATTIFFRTTGRVTHCCDKRDHTNLYDARRKRGKTDARQQIDFGKPVCFRGLVPQRALARTVLYPNRPQRYGHMAGWVSPPPARASPKFPSPWLLRTGFGCRNGVLVKGAVFVLYNTSCEHLFPGNGIRSNLKNSPYVTTILSDNTN